MTTPLALVPARSAGRRAQQLRSQQLRSLQHLPLHLHSLPGTPG